MNLKDRVKNILNNKTSLYVIIIVLGISLLLGIFRYMDLNREKNRIMREDNLVVLKYKMSQQKIDTLINEKKQLITNQTIVTSNDQASINTLSNEVFDLSKKDAKNNQTIALLKTNQQVKVDSLHVAFNGTKADDSSKTEKALQNKDSLQLTQFIKDSTVIVPKTASYSDSAISIAETITKQGFTLDSLTIPNTLNQRIVKVNGGWFKKDQYKFQSFNTSPYLHTSSEQSLLFVPDKEKGKFIKTLLWIGLGVAGALILHK